MITTTTAAAITSKLFEMEVKEGLTFILNHLDDLWPRMISTYATGGGQRLVNSFEEAMAWFKAANFRDCRISAYPKYTDYYINNTGIAPTVLFADIDIEHFSTIEEFELTTAKTYTNFENILGSQPTVLWTGGGRHYIQPQNVPVLEKIKDFQKFDQASRKFLQWEERLLSDNKADQSHWTTVSFNNMMLRIPSSLNSSLIQFDDKGRIIDIPYDARVRIEKYWDGNTPTVGRVLLMQYYNYLQFAAIRDIHKRKTMEVYGRARSYSNIHDIDWIERLLSKPLDDFRKYCITFVFTPYFLNVKRLPQSEAFNLIKHWLDRCSTCRRLDFNARQRINEAFNRVGNYRPISRDKLKEENNPLYMRLETEEVIYR